jgi:hypothetical protein
MRKNILIIALFGLAVPAVGTSEEKIDFAKQIYPFVKSGCVKCHAPPYEDERGRTRKPKAEIILATKEGILNSVDEEGNKILVPGKPDETRMLEVTKLPIDDDYHFPPEGKAPQWTDAEKELFGKWVAAGADFGDWEADPKPQEGLEWDGKEKEPGTVETAE